MSTKLYIGNLAKTVGPKSLRKAFVACGTVTSLNIITDRATGRSKGIAFVEMSSDAEAEQAIKELNGTSIENRAIEVSGAKPHPSDAKTLSGHVKGQRTQPKHRDPGEGRVKHWE